MRSETPLNTPAPTDTSLPQHWPTPDQQFHAAMDMLRKQETRLLETIADCPTEALVAVLFSCSVLFYRAEHGRNPRIRTFIDALYYISTCFSVGYANIFPETQSGKAIAAFVMLFGPALASRGLDRPRSPVVHSAPEAVGRDLTTGQAAAQIITRLEAVLDELRRR